MPHLEGPVAEPRQKPRELHIEKLEGFLNVGGGELVGEAQVVESPDRGAEVEVETVAALQESSFESCLEVQHRVASDWTENVSCLGNV